MKTIIVAIAALVLGFGAAYMLIPRSDNTTPATESTQKQQYTCGMHPEIISDEPGYCPICGMKLTPKKDGAGSEGSVSIDPTTTQNMGLVTTPVRYQSLTKRVLAFGKIAFSEPLMYSVNLKIDGWIERLFVDHEGERVHKGQPLLEVYSPALVAAQREFLIAYESSQKMEDSLSDSSAGGMTDLMQASRMRLSNWDISSDQIEQLQSSGEITRTMLIRSPTDGIVTAKNVSEGDHLKPGAELYQIADLSTVWVVAHVYEQDLPFVSFGQEATVELPNLGGEKHTARISYVSPFLNVGHQVEIRLDLENGDYRLKPEMYAEVSIISELSGDRLVIPRSAVINSGVKQLVYVALGEGDYQLRVITTGAVGDDDLLEVRSGLSENELVVTSGQFLLDSESRLSEALAEGYQVGHQHDQGHDQSRQEEVEPQHDHSAMTHAEKSDQSGVYTCPMPEHYHVLQYGEGSCPECGMALVPVEETDNESVYVCPMRECAVVQNEPGRCPKCKMKLTELLPAGEEEPVQEEPDTGHGHGGAKLDLDPDELLAIGGHDIYTCPMPQHYHVLQYGEGSCSECGMALVPVEETDKQNVYVCPMTECGVVQDHEGTCSVCGMNLVRYQPEESHD